MNGDCAVLTADHTSFRLNEGGFSTDWDREDEP